MKAKFQNKYRIESNRRPQWDYSSNAKYFLTIVTQHRECNLGEINNDCKMVLSDYGKIVEKEWLKSFEIRNELILHEFVIMPNHLHAIVEIYNEKRIETHGRAFLSNRVNTHGRAYQPDPVNTIGRSYQPDRIETYCSTFQTPKIKRNPPVRLPESISSFIAGFKSSVNTKIDDYIDANNLNIPKYNRNNHFFQPNYHDHIIRNDSEYYIIRKYIINNPQKWKEDKFKDLKKR